jgi:hypothetical protein
VRRTREGRYATACRAIVDALCEIDADDTIAGVMMLAAQAKAGPSQAE